MAKLNTTQRGYGTAHQRARRVLMIKHKDGEPCPECGKPMWKLAARNWDKQPLHADHPPGSAQKYAKNRKANLPKRLLHGKCNQSGGAWDKERKTAPPLPPIIW